MKLLDSNILIYSSQAEYAYLRDYIFEQESYVSVITKVEVLGFHRLTEEEKQYFKSCFNTLKSFDINSLIIDKAIILRQERKMSLGDAIIAATALFYGSTLMTRNVQDFEKIESLKVINPIHAN